MAKRRWRLGFPFFGSNVTKMKARGDVKGLVNALVNGVYNVRQEAEEALIELGSSAVEPLIGLLDDGDTNLRRTAVSILAKCRDARSIEALCERLRTMTAMYGYWQCARWKNYGCTCCRPIDQSRSRRQSIRACSNNIALCA